MKFVHQLDQTDCGPACLSMVASAYGKEYSIQFLRDKSFITREGVSLLGLRNAAEGIGFNATTVEQDIANLQKENNLFPCILYWNKNHFVVLLKVYQRGFKKKIIYKIADPARGIIRLSQENFAKSWIISGQMGIALFLEPTTLFYTISPPPTEKVTLKFIFGYLKPYKSQLFIIFSLLILGSVATFIFPFLTQNLIDRGVTPKNVHFIIIILLSQLSLYLGTITIDIIRNWITLFMGTKISISIISNYLEKLLQLPIKFFDSKMKGDFNQRIKDNEKIDVFLTSQSILTLFSLITFIAFFIVLWYYSVKIMIVFISLTFISVAWSYYWLRRRRMLDYFRFQNRSENQENIYEILTGITEIKINHFEDFKRREWIRIQQKLLKINVRILRVDQLQLSGFEFINQVKNIIVTFLAAILVVREKMTIGQLLSVSYIVGQMNSPINQLINFFRSSQDAKLSLERLNEIQGQSNEESSGQVKLHDVLKNSVETRGIILNNVSFQYGSPQSPFVLNNLNLFIPEGKITAIVGESGSGKTTLMKLLLKFYSVTSGVITYNGVRINDLSARDLRDNCGVVMQDGFIFSDTIERNIVTGDENINMPKLLDAINIANIGEFINSLPLKLNTKIGNAGNTISGGQKQRILISRAIYKDPNYLFFDEATSALDAKNERIIHDNLQSFFHGRTVVVIAHRLSTVKNADKIIVLKNGQIVEQGSHTQLISKKSYYYNLVKDQLELGL